MQTVGPFRLRQALGTCQVGGVWSAADGQDNQVTVAVLTATVGRDPGWRNAFAAAANALAQAGRLPLVAADFTAAAPWVAVADGDGSVVAQVFGALGMAYQPLTADPGQWVGPEPPPDEPAQPVMTPAAPPAEPAAQPIVTPPTASAEPPAAPTASAEPPAAPTEPPTAPTEPPAQPAGDPLPSSVTIPPQPLPPEAAQPGGGAPPAAGAAGWPYLPVPPGPPRRRSRHRTALLVGALALGMVVLGGGAGIAFALRPEPGRPEPTPTGGGTPPAPVAATQPGIEPPVDGEWPADWPTFAAQEPVTPITDLASVDFPFELPEGWDCTLVTNTDELVHHTCGLGGDADLIGGDLIVRACPDPCDGDRRVQLRMAVEAWGLQWVRDGGFRSWAETGQVAGEQRYGLVIVGYWRTATEGRLDRQVVFRMTGPVDQADEIRKVANSVRDAID